MIRAIRPLAALYERAILRWALRELKPTHCAVPHIVRRLGDNERAPSPLDHRQAGELPAATHRPAHGGFPDGGMPDPYSGPAEPIRPTLALVGDFTVVQNAAHRELQRQAGEAQTLRLALSEIVETLDAGGDHPRLVLIGRAALSLRGAP